MPEADGSSHKFLELFFEVDYCTPVCSDSEDRMQEIRHSGSVLLLLLMVSSSLYVSHMFAGVDNNVLYPLARGASRF